MTTILTNIWPMAAARQSSGALAIQCNHSNYTNIPSASLTQQTKSSSWCNQYSCSSSYWLIAPATPHWKQHERANKLMYHSNKSMTISPQRSGYRSINILFYCMHFSCGDLFGLHAGTMQQGNRSRTPRFAENNCTLGKHLEKTRLAVEALKKSLTVS